MSGAGNDFVLVDRTSAGGLEGFPDAGAPVAHSAHQGGHLRHSLQASVPGPIEHDEIVPRTAHLYE